jgi:hypothetical protein
LIAHELDPGEQFVWRVPKTLGTTERDRNFQLSDVREDEAIRAGSKAMRPDVSPCSPGNCDCFHFHQCSVGVDLLAMEATNQLGYRHEASSLVLLDVLFVDVLRPFAGMDRYLATVMPLTAAVLYPLMTVCDQARVRLTYRYRLHQRCLLPKERRTIKAASTTGQPKAFQIAVSGFGATVRIENATSKHSNTMHTMNPMTQTSNTPHIQSIKQSII